MRFKAISPTPNTKTKTHGNREADELSDVDHVVTSAKLSHFEAKFYIFDDNEAVIHMIIEGQSPTMRQSSLDWLFDRINWTQNPNRICGHQTSTRRHVDQKEASHVISGTILFVCSKS